VRREGGIGVGSDLLSVRREGGIGVGSDLPSVRREGGIGVGSDLPSVSREKRSRQTARMVPRYNWQSNRGKQAVLSAQEEHLLPSETGKIYIISL
jgi:hypothetical protein